MNLNFAFESVVLQPENLRYNPCDDVIFPSVIKTVGTIDNALGAYYLYYAPHDTPGGICLAYADSLQGPWTEYEQNPIIERQWTPHYEVSHVSSPHLLWMEAESKYFLYFHGENDTTRIASTTDGIHFEYAGIAVTTAMFQGISEASYARVFPCNVASRDANYVLLFMGNNGGTRRIYAAWSGDGKHFEAQPTPLISPPPGTGVTQVGAPWYYPSAGQNLVLFHGDKTPPDLQNLSTALYAADVGADFSREDHLGVFFHQHDVSEHNQRVSDPCIVEEDGGQWLFMSIGSRLKQAIAIARRLP